MIIDMSVLTAINQKLVGLKLKSVHMYCTPGVQLYHNTSSCDVLLVTALKDNGDETGLAIIIDGAESADYDCGVWEFHCFEQVQHCIRSAYYRADLGRPDNWRPTCHGCGVASENIDPIGGYHACNGVVAWSCKDCKPEEYVD